MKTCLTPVKKPSLLLIFSIVMKRLLLLLIFSIVMIGIVNAEDVSIGTVKQNNIIQLTQICSNCTYVNLTAVLYPTNIYAINGQFAMTKTGENFNYTWSDTSRLGKHIYTTCGNLNGVNTCQSVSFEVTPSGKQSLDIFLYVFLAIITLTYVLGIKTENNWIMMLASMMVLFLGFWIMINGIDIVKDYTTTRAIAFIVWGLSIISIYKSAEGLLKEGFG